MSIVATGYMYGIENMQKTAATDVVTAESEQTSVQSEAAVTLGKYTGGKLPGKKTGYQNFVSKQFSVARQYLAIDGGCATSEVAAGNVWSHMSTVWRGLDVKTKEHWDAFAKGKADEPQMGISDWTEHERSNVDLLDDCGRRQTMGDVQVRFAGRESLRSDLCVKEYLEKHDLQHVLQAALNEAVKDGSSNPRLFIANYLWCGQR